MASPSIAPALRAAHRIDLSERAWLSLLADELERLRRTKLGSNAFFYQLDPSGDVPIDFIRIDHPQITPAFAHRFMTEDSMRYVYASEPRAEFGAAHLRDASGGLPPEVESIFAQERTRDFFAFCVPDVDRGMLIGVTETTPRIPTPGHKLALEALARQLGSQLRLRRLLVDAETETTVFDSDGRCLHAEGQARDRNAQQRLRALLRQRDRAKQAAEGGSAEALDGLALWDAIIDGEYCFLDEYDEAGRRRIVALRSNSAIQALRRLSPIEAKVVAYAVRGEPNKIASLELGIAESTVAGHLGRAIAKAGLSDRAALVRTYQKLAPRN